MDVHSGENYTVELPKINIRAIISLVVYKWSTIWWKEYIFAGEPKLGYTWGRK